jgi:hypothetical protein
VIEEIIEEKEEENKIEEQILSSQESAYNDLSEFKADPFQRIELIKKLFSMDYLSK